MPIYEYWCDSCCRVASSYRQSFSVTMPPCPLCGNTEFRRVFSSFSLVKTHRDVYEDILDDRELTRGMIRDDPRPIVEWNRRMTGGERTPSEYEDVVERMDRGEWPVRQIEERRKDFWDQGDSNRACLKM